MNINLVRYDSSLNNGVNRYSKTLYSGLTEIYGNRNSIKELRVRKIEIGGHFGLISTRLMSKLTAGKLGNRDVNHATAAFLDNWRINVVTLHDVSFMEHINDYNSRYVRFNMKYLQNIFSKGKKIIVPSNVVRNMVIRNFKINADDIVSVHHGIEDVSDSYLESLENPFQDDKRHILIFGGLDNVRRKFNLILDRLQNTEYDIYVIGYGKNPIYDKYRSIRNIKFLGYQADRIVHQYIRHSDLVAYHSIDEGFGYVPLEVFMMGGKILLNDTPIFRETCGEFAFYYKNDFSDFSVMLESAMSSIKVDHRDYVKKNFSIEKMVKETMNVYLSVN